MYQFNRLPDTISFSDFALALKPRSTRRDADLEAYLRFLFKLDRILLTGSGRQALGLALQMMDTHKHEVIVPAYGCPIVPLTVKAVGKTPIFADIDPVRFTLMANKVLEAITPRTGAVVLVHEFGNLVPQETIATIRNNFDGLLIEDAAVAVGGKYADGSRPGQFGDMTIFSGSLGKPLGAVRWGALGIRNGASTMQALHMPLQPTISSMVKAILYKTLKQPSIYNLMRPVINRLSDDDSIAVDVKPCSPSSFDNFVIMRHYQQLEEWAIRQHALARQLIDVLSSNGFEAINDGNHRVALARVPFYVPQTSDKVLTQLRKRGIEAQRPFQQNLSSAEATNFPNAYRALNDTLAFTVKHSIDFRFTDALNNALKHYREAN